jgi:NADH:ubiquinone oxidoreductase subunit 6 (subunit J)
MNTGLFFCSLLLIFSLGAAMSGRMVMAALCLACSSVALAAQFLALHSPWAALAELLTGLAFAAFLFLCSRSPLAAETPATAEDEMRFFALPFLLGVLGLAFWLFSEPLARALLPAQTQQHGSTGMIFWLSRWGDCAGISGMLLAAALAVKTIAGRRHDA